MPAETVADSQTRRYSAAALTGLILDTLSTAGLPAQDAGRVAALMVEADLTGADSHGIFRLPQYLRRIQGGAVNRNPAIAVEHRSASVALVDGDNGMGHLVMSTACEAAVELARVSGAGWVGVKGSNHAGPGALYVDMLVNQGMIGLYSAVASANHMAVWGGVEPLLGTNPIAVGIPCGSAPPLLLDIATTVVSYGTVKNYVLRDQPLPEGWLVSREDGRSITDPKRTSEGLLMPIGGYKGSGLALVLGILAGVLNGAAFGRDVIDFNADSKSKTNTGHFILALDITRFMPQEVFATLLATQLDMLRDSESIPGASPIRLPGDARAVRRTERSAGGIPLSSQLVSQLDSIAKSLGITTLGERPA